jgi:hypothetical protein
LDYVGPNDNAPLDVLIYDKNRTFFSIQVLSGAFFGFFGGSNKF